MFRFKSVLAATVIALAPLVVASPSFAQGWGSKAMGFSGGGARIGGGSFMGGGRRRLAATRSAARRAAGSDRRRADADQCRSAPHRRRHGRRDACGELVDGREQRVRLRRPHRRHAARALPRLDFENGAKLGRGDMKTSRSSPWNIASLIEPTECHCSLSILWLYAGIADTFKSTAGQIGIERKIESGRLSIEPVRSDGRVAATEPSSDRQASFLALPLYAPSFCTSGYT